MITLYGIKNCNTVKKAQVKLTELGINYVFYDYKKQAVTEQIAQNWLRQVSWEKLVNRSGTTWRALSDEQKSAVVDAASALALMLEKNSVIKRPILQLEQKVICVGFDEAVYHQFSLSI